MWLFCREGFFSAVAHKDRPDYVLVLGRCAADMERLCKATGISFGEFQHATKGVDYAWRVPMEKDRWAAYLERTGREIDYRNFRDAVHGELARDTAYMHVWAAMHKFQVAKR